MSITKEKTAEFIKEFGKSEKDSGSISAQLAILTHRIKTLTEHLKENHKDLHSKRGLIALVNKRKTYLKYLKRKDLEEHTKIVSELKLRA
ncbi:MAG: 30S ribosomal protein S15 [Planctomycetota bacterium]|nr:MAG: 30S ribosomal protein S15 [Planctomycetota bacterium]